MMALAAAPLPAGPPRWTRTLRFRLLAATLAAALVALLLAGLLLAGLFRDHVMRQLVATLTAQLDQVTARLDFDAAGRPLLDAATLSDPRWSRPYSGLYWQVDQPAGAGPQRAVLRSRSLWDAALDAPADALADGALHVHAVAGPAGQPLLLVERTVRHAGGAAPAAWRLLVAADLRDTEAAVARFNGVLAASLAALLGLLCAAALAQVAVGLAPLRGLRAALAAVHEGTQARLQGRFPAELQPLVDDFNRVLERNAEVVARARTQAGNLAHALKTPLAALAQAAAATPRCVAAPPPLAQERAILAGLQAQAALADLVEEQVGRVRRQIDWHLARSRAAASQGLPGVRTPLAPVLDGLRRVLERVHAARAPRIAIAPVPPGCAFAGEVQDLHEMLGNVLDNACKWARSEVRVRVEPSAGPAGPELAIAVEDDGPGIEPGLRAVVMARGARLDESVPGSGLGLAIVQELAGLYGGRVSLGRAPQGGLAVAIRLPAAGAGPPEHRPAMPRRRNRLSKDAPDERGPAAAARQVPGLPPPRVA